jgi:hypothetical protein
LKISLKKRWGQLSSLIVVPTSQRGLLFPNIPDTQMRVLLDPDLPMPEILRRNTLGGQGEGKEWGRGSGSWRALRSQRF